MSQPKRDIPVAYLHECFDYDPLTGVVMWLHRPREHFKTDRSWRAFNKRFSGKITAQHLAGKGYLFIAVTFEGRTRSLYVHRIAHALMTGEWPEHQVDHRDGVKTNNKWWNLRPATVAEQGQNLGLKSCNTSGFMGVTRQGRQWRSAIRVKGERHYSFHPTREEAAAAYLAAKAELHPFQPIPRTHGEG